MKKTNLEIIIAENLISALIKVRSVCDIKNVDETILKLQKSIKSKSENN